MFCINKAVSDVAVRAKISPAIMTSVRVKARRRDLLEREKGMGGLRFIAHTITVGLLK